MRSFLRFLKRLFCRHKESEYMRSIYGDEINLRSGNRSEWRCRRCGAFHYKPDLIVEVIFKL